jgi:hypothetical protein
MGMMNKSYKIGIQHFVNCIAELVVCRVLDFCNIVPSCRTGTLFEIHNVNLQVAVILKT